MYTLHIACFVDRPKRDHRPVWRHSTETFDKFSNAHLPTFNRVSGVLSYAIMH